MKLFGTMVALTSIVAGGAYAGPIAINLGTAAPGGTSVLNKNLQANGYIPCTTASNSSCPSTNGLTTALPSGTPTSFTTVLFNSVQVPFDIAPSNNGTTADIWAPGVTKTTPVSSTIDVGGYTGSDAANTGTFGVDQIWTMLNDIYGAAGNQGITITLNGVAADGVTPISESVYLTAGVDYRSLWGSSVPGASGLSVQCDVANIGMATLGSNCTGETSAAVASTGTDSSYNATNVSEGVSITVDNSVYVTHDTNSGANYFLDVQDINLGGAFLNGYLDSVTITDNNPSKDDSILSALTVDATSTPEPGSVVLLGAGVGILLLTRKLRRANA